MSYKKFISLGSVIGLMGYILSGPVAFFIVTFLKPQPAWVSPEVFVANYAIIQDLPFYFGFLLVGGMLMTVTGHCLDYTGKDTAIKFNLFISLGCTVVFSGLISFNYICQTTFVHNLALNYRPEFDPAISSFSMTNPLSFCWANEMWGYAILGIATWLMAGYYRNRNNFIRWLLITNGLVSLFSAAWTIINVQWVMTKFGLISYFAWNVIMITLMMMIYMDSKTHSFHEA